LSEIKNKNPKDLIPSGPYCYFGTRSPCDPNYKPCPFWNRLEPDNAECLYLGMQDLEENIHGETSLALWDQVKECGVNRDYAEDEEI